MSAKPTPGPYTIDGKRPDVIRIRGTVGEIVAAFPLGPGIDRAQALANAHAWVDVMAAMKKLDRICSIVYGSVPADEQLRLIRLEAKP